MKILVSLSSDISVDEFMVEAELAYKKQFPRGWMYTQYSDKLGESVSLVWGIQPKNKHQNNIEHNDPARHVLVIHDVKDRKFKDKITVSNAGGTLQVKPAPDSHMAYDSVKFGWRKKTGTPSQCLKHLENYFKKMRKVVDENEDRLAHDIS